MMKEFQQTYYLSAGECDPQGELPMPLLLARLIDVATHHANAWGVGYARLIQNRQAWVLSRVTIEMERMPRVDERYTLVTWVEDYNSHFSQRNFEVQDDAGRPVGFARTVWIVIDLDKRAMVDIAGLSGIAGNVSERPCPIPPQGRLKPLSEGDDTSHQFQYAECDFNRHVNTVRYLELLMNRFQLRHYDTHRLRRVELAFVKETYCADVAVVRLCRQAEQDWRANVMVDGADHVRSRLLFAPRR